MQRIKAIFIGTNSLGYEKNKQYILEIAVSGSEIHVHPCAVKGPYPVKYSNFMTFLDNWDNIIHI